MMYGCVSTSCNAGETVGFQLRFKYGESVNLWQLKGDHSRGGGRMCECSAPNYI